MFGRNEITDGTLNGKVDGHRHARAAEARRHIVAANIKYAARLARNGRRRCSSSSSLDVTYDERGGKVTLVGTERLGRHVERRPRRSISKHLTAATATHQGDEVRLEAAARVRAGSGQRREGHRSTRTSRFRGFDPRGPRRSRASFISGTRASPIAPSVGTVRQANIDIVITDEADQGHRDRQARQGRPEARRHDRARTAPTSIGRRGRKLVLQQGLADRRDRARGRCRDHGEDVAAQDERWTADVIVDKGFVKINKTRAKRSSRSARRMTSTSASRRRSRSRGRRDGAQVRTHAPAPVAPGLIAHVTLKPIKVEADEFRTTVHGKLDVTTDASTIGVIGTIEATERRSRSVRSPLSHRARRGDVRRHGRSEPRDRADHPRLPRCHDGHRGARPAVEARARARAPTRACTRRSELLGFLLGGEPGGDPQSA